MIFEHRQKPIVASRKQNKTLWEDQNQSYYNDHM